MVTWFMILLGVGGVLSAAWMYRAQSTMRAWETTSATVLESKVVETQEVGARRGWNFEPWARYRYTVGGRELESTTVYSAVQRMQQPEAEAVLKELGEHPTAHYNPANPSESYLVPVSLSGVWISLAGGALFLLMGLGRLLVGR